MKLASSKKGENIEIVGHDSVMKATATGIEMFKKQLDDGQAGDTVGILLKGFKRDELRRGHIACKPGSLKLHNKFNAQIFMATVEDGGRKKPIIQGNQLNMYSRTWNAISYVEMPGGVDDKTMVMPGEEKEIGFVLAKKFGVENGQRFTLRCGTNTVGYGVVTKVLENEDMEKYMEGRKAIKKAKKKAEQEAQAM